MKNKTQLNFMWEIWHLLTSINQLIWNYYEDEFVELCLKKDDEKSMENKTEDDFVF